jgi:hypothetical protein
LTLDSLADLDSSSRRQPLVLGWLDRVTRDAVEEIAANSDGTTRAALSRALQVASPESASSSGDALMAAVEDRDDVVAVQAILTLAWLGTADQADSLVAHAQGGAPVERVSALLFSAVALGSMEALAAVRRGVDSDDEPDPYLIDALAVAGDESDADRLLRRAKSNEPHLERTVLAIGHLGSTTAAAALAQLRGSVRDQVLDEALRATFGEIPLGRPLTTATQERLLRGRPWSIKGVTARLSAADEPVRSRERLALELAVRTGVRPPVRYDSTAPAANQTRAAQAFTATFGASVTGLRAGRWYYFGRAVPKGAGWAP